MGVADEFNLARAMRRGEGLFVHRNAESAEDVGAVLAFGDDVDTDGMRNVRESGGALNAGGWFGESDGRLIVDGDVQNYFALAYVEADLRAGEGRFKVRAWPLIGVGSAAKLTIAGGRERLELWRIRGGADSRRLGAGGKDECGEGEKNEGCAGHDPPVLHWLVAGSIS
jgi:hypothetical protein